ncbi:hypothetical protein LCGC14_1302580 [marine sediment metagenome]|uniref:Uncharacterized protein n=1 Tax=marine sediment metagenome TaxID=412755 RepID=A0A0F9N5R9_9ZZZZ
MTDSDRIKKIIREYGLPRKPCGCATEFSVYALYEDEPCAKCEKEDKE